MNSKELEPQAERALKFLHEKAAEHGQDRANADYMDGWVKAELARIKGQMIEATADGNFIKPSDAAATSGAMRHPDYLEALQAKKEADTKHYTNMFKREAASAIIEAWRTVCSNERANV